MHSIGFTDLTTDESNATGVTTINFNRDYSGDVFIIRETMTGTVKTQTQVSLPIWQLKEFIAGYVIEKKTDRLGQLPADQVLGL